jgi:hypothetical protein
MPRHQDGETRIRAEKLLADNKAFFNQITDPDDFRAIIMGQVYIETMLSRLLEKNSLSEKGRFYVTVAHAYKNNLFEDFWKRRLEKLGDIRNIFAHELGGTLRPHDAAELRTIFEEDGDTILLDFFSQSIVPLLGKNDASPEFLDRVTVRSAMMIVYTFLMQLYNDDKGVLLTPSPFAEALVRFVDHLVADTSQDT